MGLLSIGNLRFVQSKFVQALRQNPAELARAFVAGSFAKLLPPLKTILARSFESPPNSGDEGSAG